MKIAVFADVHANLPALEAALATIELAKVDLLVHLGDVIAIGPQPAECLATLLNLNNSLLIRGNHDTYFCHGLPNEMHADERRHQLWTHAQLDSSLKNVVADWPLVQTAVFEGVQITFLHYALEPDGHDFVPIVAEPTAQTLDGWFAPYQSDLVFYGHHHPAAEAVGQSCYLNPGSLGCAAEAMARFVLLTCENGRYTFTHHAVPYDDAPLRDAFAQRAVPERHFLNRAFFGNRL